MDKIRIDKLEINNLTYKDLIPIIGNSIRNKEKITIGYVNANSFNLSYKNDDLTHDINSFDFIHPDGIGIYIAAKLLGIKPKTRFTGSDFYLELIQNSIKEKWSYFFFGHDEQTLKKICLHYPELRVNGIHQGYTYETQQVINEINKSGAEICVIGLSTPIQEKWIAENKDNINARVIISAGDGIKVFAGIKVRGPLIMQKLGLEWLVRMLNNPLKYYRRYLIGNPLFLYRIIKLKFSKLTQLNL